MTTEKDRYVVPGLQRGLRLLSCFTRETPELGPGELARALDLPRTTVFRLAHTLETMGFLSRVDGAKTYRLGSAVLGLGFEYLASRELSEVARPALERLRDETGASSHLAVRDHADIIYLSRYAGRSALTSNIRVGSRLAAHASSMGRALLADLGDGEFETLYRDRALEKFTDQTPVDLSALRALLAEDRRRGYVVSRSFYERGVVSVAAPVRDAGGRAVAAINVTAAEQSVDAGALEGAIRESVLRAADAISSLIGGNSGLSRTAAE